MAIRLGLQLVGTRRTVRDIRTLMTPIQEGPIPRFYPTPMLKTGDGPADPPTHPGWVGSKVRFSDFILDFLTWIFNFSIFLFFDFPSSTDFLRQLGFSWSKKWIFGQKKLATGRKSSGKGTHPPPPYVGVGGGYRLLLRNLL